MTPLADIQYQTDPSRVIVQNETPEGNIENGTPTCSEQVSGMTHTGGLKARKAPVVDVLTTRKALKEDYETTFGRDSGGHQTPVGGHKISEKDGDNTINRDNGVHLAPERYKLRIHGPRNQMYQFSPLDEGDDKRQATKKRIRKQEREFQKAQK